MWEKLGERYGFEYNQNAMRTYIYEFLKKILDKNIIKRREPPQWQPLPLCTMPITESELHSPLGPTKGPCTSSFYR